jgi:hypothetical protein
MRSNRLTISTFAFWALTATCLLLVYKYWELNKKYGADFDEFEMKIGEYELKKVSLENDHKTCREQHETLNTKYSECQVNYQNYKNENEVKSVNSFFVSH